MTKRLSGLDGIRAISITLVLVFHLTASAGLRPWEAGAFGVDIFFVLSGFLITWLICGEEAETATISLRAFYTRRALRILPPAITYLAALVILARFGWGSISLSDITHCLLFVRNLFGGAVTTAHYWTLSVEEQFYLLWPIAMVLLRTNRTRLKIASLLVLAAPFWRFVNYHWLGTAATINGARFDLRYDAILIGCCLALLRNDPSLGKYLQQGILQSRWTPPIAVASLIVLVKSGHWPTLAYATVAILINYVLDHSQGWVSVLNWGPISWVGRLSYSIYIWQQVFCWGSPLGWLGRFPQNLVATLAMATLSYYFVEQPFAKLRKRVRFTASPRLFSKIKLQAPLTGTDPSTIL